LCTCLCNVFIIYKIPLMKSALNSGDVFAIAMMVRVNALPLSGLVGKL
jgi:hypothetical protein